ncbi:hypothetical protein [Flavihumibacter sp. CACIAM 22H1]|uniref:hypothetical protein n=1 Tax=Flavihumibacter sp. CACIAM 22H1 TaxID=1812911 RepID=UPI0007A90F71|nr:hypothetical protein [Flavihumibacter sp. CACIAM 22H1]KYP13815.1 MAG: hypothetical protein A1D16_11395 [Flavihumibacter sp. CACIAM 22H1]
MKKFDFNLFFFRGEFNGITQVSTETDLINHMGKPDDVEDYGDNGKFFHYGEIRVSLNRRVEYVDIFFINTDAKFDVSIEENYFLIDKNTTVSAIVHMLNLANLKWVISYEKSNLDYLLIEVGNGLSFYFYLSGDKLERISLFF